MGLASLVLCLIGGDGLPFAHALVALYATCLLITMHLDTTTMWGELPDITSIT